MLTISRSLWLLKDNLSFFATEKEIKRLISELSWNEVLRIQHTSVVLLTVLYISFMRSCNEEFKFNQQDAKFAKTFCKIIIFMAGICGRYNNTSPEVVPQTITL